MWNPFKKKEKPPAPAVNRVEDLADSLHRDSRSNELESELHKLDRTGLSAAEQESWWHIYGITAFQRGENTEALHRFQQAYEQFPNSSRIRFSLGQQYERLGNIDKAFDLFSAGRFPELPREFVLAQARYAYLWDRYEDGRKFVRPFFDAYKELRILDDHFLYVRGVPFFGTAWSYLAAFSVLSGEWKELEEVTRFVVKHCSDYDFEELQLELRAHREGKPELFIAPMQKRIQGHSQFPVGYFQMNIAVANARLAGSAHEAEAVLATVQLTKNDHRWLEDIRTLAKAEVAHRFGQSDAEHEHIAAFLQRQPMLFEPDIALNFHLLRYQERLKPHYRKLRVE
jgi:tetratricopeptide (TPR) repeat protein